MSNIMISLSLPILLLLPLIDQAYCGVLSEEVIHRIWPRPLPSKRNGSIVTSRVPHDLTDDGGISNVLTPVVSSGSGVAGAHHCIQEGVFPVPGSCKDFYRCEQQLQPGVFSMQVLSCPIGTIFHSNSHSCIFVNGFTNHQECTTDKSFTVQRISNFNLGMDITRTAEYGPKRSKRLAVATVLTGLIAAGSLASAANGIVNTGLSLSKKDGGFGNLKGLENRLLGIEGKIQGVDHSILESQIINRINSRITQCLIAGGIDSNRKDFEVTQKLIDQGFIENRIGTATTQGLIIQGHSDNEANFAKVQVSIGELKQFMNEEIEKAKEDIRTGFESVSTSIDQSRIEPLISELLTLIKGFHEKSNHLQSLPEANRKDEIEKSGGYLEYLESSTLKNTLQNIIEQKLAIPNSASDLSALFLLELLVHGLQVHAAMLSSIVSSNVYLASEALKKTELEEFNTNMIRVQSALSKAKIHLGYKERQGLIGKVKKVIRKVQFLPYIKSNSDINDVLYQKTGEINQLESAVEDLVSYNTELEEPGTIVGKPNFSSSLLRVPLGQWENGKQVSYAIQFASEEGLSKVGEWSRPYTVLDKASPTIRLPRVQTGIIRILYRRFNQEKAVLVGIMRDHEQTLITDIGRDIIDIAARPNEDIAIKEINSIINANGIDINISLENKMTPLHYAAKNGNVNIMDILISNGADIHARASDNQEALHFAAVFGTKEGVEYLINKGANINAQTSLLGLSPLHLTVANSHAEATWTLLENGAFINIKDNNGLTPLHVSIAGNGVTIDELLSKEDIDINAVTEDGLTPLHYAARSTSNIFVQKLLQNVDINVNALSEFHLSPLHLAAMGGNEDIITELYQAEALVSSADKYGATALHYAAFYGNKRAVLVLLQLDPSLEDKRNYENKTALDLAVENGRKEIIDILGSDEENMIVIMTQEFTENSTVLESNNSTASSPEQGKISNCSGEAADDMAKGSEETCVHVGHVNSYVNLVMSMIPLRKYYSNQLEYSQIFGDYDDDLIEAQRHAKIWRNGESIVNGIKLTFKLAKKFEPEFQRKYKINQLRMKRIKANANQEKHIKQTKEDIKSLEQQIQEATEAMGDVEVASVKAYFQNFISSYESQIEEKKKILQENFTLVNELDELIAFLDFVRSDSSKIQKMAVKTRGRIELFRDYLVQDKSAFERHGQIASDTFNKLEAESIKKNEALAEYKRKQVELKAEIDKERAAVKERFQRIENAHQQLRDLRRKLLDRISSSKTMKIIGAILTPFIIGIPILISANNEEKTLIKQLQSAVDANKAELDTITRDIQMRYAEIDVYREVIANSSSNAKELRDEMTDFITLNRDLQTLSSEVDTLLEAITKAVVGIEAIRNTFDDVTKKLGEMIDLAASAKTEAERINAKYFIYNELSLLQCNWKDVYIKVMNLEECTRNFEVLY